uniref:START domain-containing protein 10 n=1 Tax=Neogobius melanostomus TaxID=47308 RepID=A0A8C6SMY1_9GOBI
MASSILPDDSVFLDFRTQCLSTENWLNKYDKSGMQVWVEKVPAAIKTNNNVSRVHKIKCQMVMKDVSAATMYDVIHDGEYRRTWDPAMLESHDIARLSPNADVGYYAWSCPKPLKHRDVVTLRSWQVTEEGEYIVVNFSVKHPEYPPRSDLVRAVSIQTGYYIKPIGPNSCTFIYLSQADPKGSLPKWIVNKASQSLAPRVMRCVHKAGQNYNILPEMDPAKLSIQRGDSLENVDERSKTEMQDSEDSC